MVSEIEIGDFETENLMATYKFRLTHWTLNQYSTLDQVLQSEKNCLKARCLADQTENLEEFRKCITNCETGQREVLTMQYKHAEVARLTYAKNIQRCLSVHGNLPEDGEERLTEEDSDLNETGLARCISHNTDKVDRRFFGYYSTQRGNLINKYEFSALM